MSIDDRSSGPVTGPAPATHTLSEAEAKALLSQHGVPMPAERLAAATPDDGEVEVLVAPMLKGNRELIAGLADDPQFGMTVVLGIGGIFTEALADVSIRLVPIERVDA